MDRRRLITLIKIHKYTIEYRKRQKDGKLEKIAKTARGAHIIHGIDTNVWDDSVFR